MVPNLYQTYDVAPGREQLVTPFHHADGDPMEIYLLHSDDDTLTLSDCGMTLMRLSYAIDISDSIMNSFQKIVNGYRMKFSEETGSIYTKVPATSFESYLPLHRSG